MTERERDLDRLLTFVDAVVAIAITLLVLPLTEVGETTRDAAAVDVLREQADNLFAFFLSFVVIAQLWLGQHQAVSSLVRQSPAVVRLLFAWSLTIVFLPFPTALVAVTGNDDAVVKVLYIGTMAVNSALLALLARVVAGDRDLRDTDAGPDPTQATAITAGFLVALAVSVAVPATGYWPLLLLTVIGPVVDRIRRTRRYRRAGT